jgi:hypothetical protein
MFYIYLYECLQITSRIILKENPILLRAQLIFLWVGLLLAYFQYESQVILSLLSKQKIIARNLYGGLELLNYFRFPVIHEIDCNSIFFINFIKKSCMD